MNIVRTEQENQGKVPYDLTPEEQRQLDEIEQEERENRQKKFGFDPEIEMELLGHLLRSKELLARCAGVVRPEWFTIKAHVEIVRTVIDTWTDHQVLPSRGMLSALLRDRLAEKKPEYRLTVMAALINAYEYHGDASTLAIAESKLLDFARRAERQRIALDLIEKEDDDDAMSRLESLKTLGNRNIIDRDGIEFLDYAEAYREEWLVDGWLPRRVLCLFSGVQKLGKSTVGFALASSGVRGLDWFGHHVAAPFPVVYLDYENPVAFAGGNLKAYMTREELLPWRQNLRVVDQDSLPHGLTAGWIKKYLASKGLLNRPGLLVIDSAIRAFAGLCAGIPNWDNSSSEVNRILKPLQELARQTGWTIIIIHHENKTGSTTGSQQWEAVPDYVWRFTRHQDDFRRLHIKGRLLHRPADLLFRWDNARSRIELKDAPRTADRTDEEKLLAALPVFADEDEARRSGSCPSRIKLAEATGLSDQQVRDRLAEMTEQLQVFGFQENNNRARPKQYWRKS